MTVHHSRHFVEALHAEQLKLHGGASGIRDEGMLESALARPLMKEDYGAPDLFDLAAAYLFGIVKNHPFVDGNKRTGFAAADTLLALNGFSFEVSDEDVIQFVLKVASSEIDEEGAAACFRDHSVPLDDPK